MDDLVIFLRELDFPEDVFEVLLKLHQAGQLEYFIVNLIRLKFSEVGQASPQGDLTLTDVYNSIESIKNLLNSGNIITTSHAEVSTQINDTQPAVITEPTAPNVLIKSSSGNAGKKMGKNKLSKLQKLKG